jgi:serine protease Do
MKRIALAATVIAVLAVSPAPAKQTSARRTPVVDAVEKARPAVVNIYTERIVETPFNRRSPYGPDPFFDRFFNDFFRGPQSQKRTRERRSLGSGVLVDESGIVVTNEHVIVHASEIRVLLADERQYKATLVGANSDSDLAVLRIESDDPLPYVPLPKSDDILIGETVVAIGNPFGLSHTVTVGVVSAVGRTIQAADIIYHDFIQTDASINPGNSGGPLVNVDGRLIGINTAIHAQGEGIGFAIPVRRVRNIVEQILHHGHVQPPWIGVQVQNLTPEIAFHFHATPGAGVLINGVDADSPAARAGLERGHVIVRAQRQPIGNTAAFARAIKGLTAGDPLELKVLVDGKTAEMTLELSTVPKKLLEAFAWRGLGLSVTDHDSGEAVVVTKVRSGGPAAIVGIRPGDAIAAMGGLNTTNVAAFERASAKLRNSNNVLVSVVRDRRLYRVTLAVAR